MLCLKIGMLSEIFARNWWTLAVRGVLSILFGVLALAIPGLTLAVLVTVFGCYAILDGVFSITAGYRRHKAELPRWGVPIVLGLLSIAAGIFAFGWPGITATALALVMGVWATTIGFLEIIVATQARKRLGSQIMLMIAGALSVVFGFLIFSQPAAGALVLVSLIGAYAIVSGCFRIAAAYRLRRFAEAIDFEHERDQAA